MPLIQETSFLTVVFCDTEVRLFGAHVEINQIFLDSFLVYFEVVLYEAKMFVVAP